MSIRNKFNRAVFLVMIFLLAMFIIFFGIEQAMFMKMSSDLKNKYGNNYAILNLHMGGESFQKPSLWEMLKVVYEYNFTGNYEPQGSGGYTGKQYYLTLLISNNIVINDCHWSFRKFGLEFFESTRILPWDIISNLPEETAYLYKFKKQNRVRRSHLWFSGDSFNNENVRFYYRETKNLEEER